MAHSSHRVANPVEKFPKKLTDRKAIGNRINHLGGNYLDSLEESSDLGIIKRNLFSHRRAVAPFPFFAFQRGVVGIRRLGEQDAGFGVLERHQSTTGTSRPISPS